MATYNVEVPIAGIAFIEVTADSEEDAIQKAMQDIDINNIEEWDCFNHIMQGNILYAPLNSVEVELIDDEEE